ncbi:MAG TPA: hypothetical protein VFG21_12520 [Xanthomonadaceae bacterium]|nr:hypothetical protein [Xanthomonadaceae bacterium]
MIRTLVLVLSLAMVGCTGAQTPPSTDRPASVEAAPDTVDFSCSTDADCAVKDVGNCCGYYPACVNIDSPTFPERVQAQCEREGRMSVCGFPSLLGCRCVEGRCEGVTGAQGGETRID